MENTQIDAYMNEYDSVYESYGEHYDDVDYNEGYGDSASQSLLFMVKRS